MSTRDDVRVQIRRALALLFEPGDVIELRAPNAGRAGVVSGYYDDPDALARDGVRLAVRRDLPGIYVTPNPVKAALLARAANRFIERAKHTTSDADIACRRWLLVDLDPVRPAGVSSTNAEHDAALALARQARDWLAELGMPHGSIVLADSGNGAHLLVRVELPNDTESTELCKRCLAALDLRLSSDEVHVDTTTCNAARIWKLYGTAARKGDPTLERPHRRARLLDVPDRIEVALRDTLEGLATLAPTAPEPDRGAPRLGGAALDAAAWLAEHAVAIAFEAPWSGGRKWVLSECPFAADDHGRDRAAFVVQHASGAIAAGCQHARCTWTWRELRAKYEPTSRRREHTNSGGAGVSLARLPVVVRLADVEPEAVDWLWYPYIPRGKLTLLEGDPSAGKTWLALTIAAIVSRGWPWPDVEDGIPRSGHEPEAVLYMTAEDGIADTIRPRLDAAGADVSRVYCLTASRDADGAEHSVTLRDVDVLDAALSENKPALLAVDPLQAYLGADVDMHRANEVRPVLAAFARLAERHGCAVLCIRHLSKARAERALYRGLGSIDFAAAARSVLLAARDPEHDNRRAVVHLKSSCAPEGGSIGYLIEAGRLQWTGKSDLTAAAANAPEADDEERSAIADAVDYLRAALAEGSRAAKQLQRDAREAGISERTLWRAKRALGVRARRQVGGGAWVWDPPTLPSLPHSDLGRDGRLDAADTETGLI